MNTLDGALPARIHVTGGPGRGKTVAADRLAALLGVPVYHLDYEWLDAEAGGALPPDLADKVTFMAEKAASMAAAAAWVSEGAFLGWTGALLSAADIIIWMNVPWRIASYRILSRQVRLNIAGTNRFPSWRKLVSFWRWSAGFYTNRNAFGLNPYGTPNTLATMASEVARYSDKLVHCSHREDPLCLLRLREPA